MGKLNLKGTYTSFEMNLTMIKKGGRVWPIPRRQTFSTTKGVWCGAEEGRGKRENDFSFMTRWQAGKN